MQMGIVPERGGSGIEGIPVNTSLLFTKYCTSSSIVLLHFRSGGRQRGGIGGSFKMIWKREGGGTRTGKWIETGILRIMENGRIRGSE